ncbi:MAG: CHASE3 domain-containing protein, partial [Chlorobium sp.]|nr:CHASE3 domain-containing protein [Chlorobium sp.]
MQNTKIRSLAIFGFLLAAALIFGSTFYMRIHLQAFAERTRQVQRSLHTEHKLDEILSLVTDSETGPRGYVIMGQEVFLEPYFAAISPTDGIIPRLKELRQLTIDNPRQQQQHDQLELLVAEKLRFMQNLVEVRRNAGFDAAKELIATDIGRQAMVNVSRQLQKMRAIETSRLQQLSDEASAELQQTISAMIIGLGSGIALLLFSFLVVNREVSQRKKAEEALQQFNSELNVRIAERVQELQKSEEGFRMLVESVKDYAIFMLDTDGNIITWNSGAELLSGYTALEMIGQNYSLFFTPEDLAAGTPSRFLKTALEHRRLEAESWRVRKDGAQFLSDVLMTPIYDDHRQMKGFAMVIRDITLRKQNEVRIEHLNRLYATLSQINETLVRVKEKEELFPTICRVTVESGKFELAWIGVLDPVSGAVIPAVTYGKGAHSIPVVSSNQPEALIPPDLLSSAVATGKVVACKNIQTDPAMQQWR